MRQAVILAVIPLRFGTFAAPPASRCCPQNLFKRCLLGGCLTQAVMLEFDVPTHCCKGAIGNSNYKRVFIYIFFYFILFFITVYTIFSKVKPYSM